MRTTVSSVLRALAVTSGLGLVWFVTAGELPLSAGGSAALVATGLALAALGAAASTTAAVVRASRHALALLAALSSSSTRRTAAPEPLHPITQARPDAAGRPLPRAPGRFLPVVPHILPL
ncbi:hypothetical protein GCM10009851_32200 [Herbiconiux moechotypicola]|uniref:Uncharacterized protein n=2 Tax=Herbiconiux moechotypicola TaxID=637393 RepID=A0ABN3DZD6_9MICO